MYIPTIFFPMPYQKKKKNITLVFTLFRRKHRGRLGLVAELWEIVTSLLHHLKQIAW